MTNKNEIEQLFKTYYTQLYRLATTLLHDNYRSRNIVHEAPDSDAGGCAYI